MSLTISPQSVMFGGHRLFRKRKIKFSIFHMTSRNHVIRESLGGRILHFVFNLSHNLTRPRGQRVKWHYEWVSPHYKSPSCQVTGVVQEVIPCQVDKGLTWPISNFDETFPHERYIWDKIILENLAQADNPLKSYGTTKLAW